MGYKKYITFAFTFAIWNTVGSIHQWLICVSYVKTPKVVFDIIIKTVCPKNYAYVSKLGTVLGNSKVLTV